MGWVIPLMSFLSVSAYPCERLLYQASRHADALFARIDQGTKSVSLNGPHSDKIRLDVRGVPHWLERISSVQGMKLRHYVKSQEGADAILATQTLVAGFTPYVRSDYPPRWFIEKYLDLTGVFLTTRDLRSEAVGLFSDEPYVEIELLPGTPLIEVERDRIYLIAGPPGTVVPVRAFAGMD